MDEKTITAPTDDHVSGGLSPWSWSVRRQLALRRARMRKVRLAQAASVTLLALGATVAAPLVYQFTLGDQAARHEGLESTQDLERAWRASLAATPSPTPAMAMPTPGVEAQAAGFSAASLPHRYPIRYPDGETFAILHIPAIGLTNAIAEGVEKASVLDHGLVGHYSRDQETAFPWQRVGNFAIAAHRITHGAPFSRLEEVRAGDEVVVETAYEYYVYRITGGIEEVSPTDVDVLRPVPAGSSFDSPGRYLTLTTCTPEYSSRGRLIRFGRLVKVVQKSAHSTGIPTL
ncbi:class E sortase [Streptomyces sp. NPDC005122]